MTKMTKLPVDELIDELVNRHGMTQDEIATAVNCDQGHISRLLNRRRRRPNAELYVDLMNLLAQKRATRVAGRPSRRMG